ncbi:MAG: alpha/beta hydrolase [Desulfosalsimonadaceae bacterium]
MAEIFLNDGRSIFYKTIAGSPANPCLVFLHEGLGCTAMWKDFPELLCRRTRCPGVVYDRPGYGRSSPDTAFRTIHYMHHAAFNDLQLLIDKVIPGRPFVLAGHSDGASISLISAAEKPSRLKGVISEAAHVFVESETLKGIEKADAAFEEGQFQGLYKHHGEKTERVFKSWAETWLSRWFWHWNIEYLLPSIECPLLVIQGAEDSYGTRRQVEAIADQTSGSAESCLIPDCGHAPHAEQPEKTLEVMAAFIERIIS